MEVDQGHRENKITGMPIACSILANPISPVRAPGFRGRGFGGGVVVHCSRAADRQEDAARGRQEKW